MGKPRTLTPEAAAVAYRIPLIDYEREATGCVISAGSGIGMALMDYMPHAFRYLVDTDQLKPEARLQGFAIIAARLCPPVAFVGVHLANQRLMADAAKVTGSPFYSLIGHIPAAGPRQVHSLEELRDAIEK